MVLLSPLTHLSGSRQGTGQEYRELYKCSREAKKTNKERWVHPDFSRSRKRYHRAQIKELETVRGTDELQGITRTAPQDLRPWRVHRCYLFNWTKPRWIDFLFCYWHWTQCKISWGPRLPNIAYNKLIVQRGEELSRSLPAVELISASELRCCVCCYKINTEALPFILAQNFQLLPDFQLFQKD